VSVSYCDVGAGYFKRDGNAPVARPRVPRQEPGRPVIINEFMARRFWGSADAAMGRFLRVDDKDYR